MTTLRDLKKAESAFTHLKADVCVIGTGAAGLYIANRLLRSDLNVVMVEAGDRTCESGAKIGIEPLFAESRYIGAEEGRAFGWGGTSSRWGGLLIPYSAADKLSAVGADSAAWAHIIAVVDKYGDTVRSVLGLEGAADFLSLPEVRLGARVRCLQERGIDVLASEILPFGRRNLTYLADTRSHGVLQVYLNAVACEWMAIPGPDGTAVVSAVDAVSSSRKKLRVTASFFVIAAGAVETARILLEMDRATSGRMFPSAKNIGTLSDHLSWSVADVTAVDRGAAAALFGPFFLKGRMRTFRFVQRANGADLPRHFAHYIFEIDNPGMRLARNTLAGLQRRSVPEIRLMDVLEGMTGLSGLAYHRLIRSRLFIPGGTPAHLQLDIEQAPDPANRVSLAAEKDSFGRPRALVRWRVNELDYENVRSLSRAFLARWPDDRVGFPRLVPRDAVSTRKPFEAYHPVATCRMGSDGDAVVDFDLRVRGTSNVHVLTTGIFPAAGTANPTFSLLCIGELLAERLSSAAISERQGALRGACHQ